MAVTTAKSADGTALRPFTIETHEDDLDDLRARIAATRWPEKEPVEDQSQGVQLATMQVPRSWAERAYPNLIHFNEVDRGGHFAAWEQPELFVSEVRTGLRSLR
jgi:Epoxide hydrolase N terminus